MIAFKKIQIKSYIKLIPLLSVIVIAFLSIAYASLEQTTIAQDVKANIRLKSDIRITNVVVDGMTNSAMSNGVDYNREKIIGNIELPENASTVTYKVKVSNFGNVAAGLFDITGLPSNLTYTVSGYELKDKICNTDNVCKLGIEKEFYITIKYATDGYDSNNYEYNINLDFDFRRFYNISYQNITNNGYPTEYLQGTDVTIDLTGQGYTKIKVDGSANYTCENELLSITNPNGELVVRYPIHTVTFDANGGTIVGPNSFKRLWEEELKYKSAPVKNSGATIAGGKATFDGVDDWIDLFHDNYDLGSSITWVAKFSVASASASGDALIIGNWEGAGGGIVYQNHKIYTDLYNSTSATYVQNVSPASITPETDYFVVATYDGANIKLYINNELMGTVNNTGSIPVSTAKIALGANSGGNAHNPSAYSNATIYKAAVYTEALSAAQISEMYNNDKLLYLDSYLTGVDFSSANDFMISEPTRTGYIFDGWYTEKNGGTRISETTATPDEEVTYYAHWTPVIEDGIYTIRTATSDSYGMAVYQGTVADGDNVCEYVYNNYYGSQDWTVQMNSDGTYSIYSMISARYLDIANNTMAAGTNIQQYGTSPGAARNSFIIEKEGNYYILRAKTNDNFAVAAASATAANSVNIQLAEYSKVAQAKWNFISKTAVSITDKTIVRTYKAPYTGYYLLETYGAQGGNFNWVDKVNNWTVTGVGGKGGYSKGYYYATKGKLLYVVTGKQGTNYNQTVTTSSGSASVKAGTAGGYNGGGKGGNGYSNISPGGAGGGGATHIATATGTLSSLSSNKSSVLIVAGGGGGSAFRAKPGAGGGTSGGNSTSNTVGGVVCGGKSTGGTQTSGYAFGQGQAGSNGVAKGSASMEGSGGAGGGYWGGKTSTKTSGTAGGDDSGSGGSGYIGGVTQGTTTAGQREGNGMVKITYVGTTLP